MKPVKIYVCVCIYIYIIVKSTYQSIQGMTFSTSVKCTTYIRGDVKIIWLQPPNSAAGCSQII